MNIATNQEIREEQASQEKYWHKKKIEQGKFWRENLESQGVSCHRYQMNFKEHEATSFRFDSIEEFAHRPRGTITMAGSCGTGKTLTAVAIFASHVLKNGIGARFVNAETLYQTWRDESVKGFVANLIDKMSTCPLLIIDDIGQGDITGTYKKFIYSVLNERWARDMPMVLTTNLTGPEFAEMFGAPISSRIAQGEVWKFIGKDHRF